MNYNNRNANGGHANYPYYWPNFYNNRNANGGHANYPYYWPNFYDNGNVNGGYANYYPTPAEPQTSHEKPNNDVKKQAGGKQKKQDGNKPKGRGLEKKPSNQVDKDDVKKQGGKQKGRELEKEPSKQVDIYEEIIYEEEVVEISYEVEIVGGAA